MRTYFESSALVKLFIDESGSEWARECWAASPDRFTSRISYVEVRAALGAARRSGRISDEGLAAARQHFDHLWSRMDVTEVAPRLIEHAALLAERHGLRGYDAVQLASAIETRDSDPINLLSWDADLVTAACEAGINVIRTRDT